MTRRTHPCLACSGRTRHRAACGPCRRRGVKVTDGQIVAPIDFRGPRQFLGSVGRMVFLAGPLANPNAPTRAELERGTDVSTYLSPRENS